ncbi:YtcA family lipoprotein [Pseudoroseomonas wenyumeiae]
MPANVCAAQSGSPIWRRLAQAAACSGPAALSLAGCDAPLSPAVPFLGAYFPFWLICAATGVLGAVVLRVIFVKIGIDEHLPLRLLVYACLAAIMGLALALALYGR